MRILIAPDKFKGSLDASAVAAAIAEGLRRADPNVQLDLCPMADGGEGTVAALVAATGGTLINRRVTGPLPEMQVDAAFGILGNLGDAAEKVAVIEMSAASGLALMPCDQLNPEATTTFGTGQLMRAAAEMGATQIILGIGGSATIDAGIGAAQACELPVIMRDGQPLSPTEPVCGRDIADVVMIKHGRGSPIDRVSIIVASDVNNPLYGPNGAAVVYGPQKGATPDQVQWFDAQLRALAVRSGKTEFADRPGAGAAGGMGFGLMAWFLATLKPGAGVVAEACNLEGRIADADLCITGEGRLDSQSASGKTVDQVAALCRKHNVPCLALAGSIAEDLPAMHGSGLTAHFPICRRPMTLEQAIAEAPQLLAAAAENVLRLWRAAAM
jgi:glycerate 2-kinase